MLEIAGSAIFLGQPGLTGVELGRSAAGTLGGGGAVVIGDVVVTDVSEPKKSELEDRSRMLWAQCEDIDSPMNLILIGEETQADRMHRSITPALVVEAARPVQVLKIGRVLLASEELHIANFEVGPEVAGRVSIGSLRVLGSELIIGEPVHHIVLVQVGRVRSEELLGLGPE